MEAELNKLIVEEEEEGEEDNIIIRGDFNVRIGDLGGCGKEKIGEIRNSKDKIISNGGRNLRDWEQEKGWYILNGTSNGDRAVEYTYAQEVVR